MLHHNRRLSEDSLVAGELDEVESHGRGKLDEAGHTEARPGNLGRADYFDHTQAGKDVTAGRVDEDKDRVGLGHGQEVTDEARRGKGIDVVVETHERALLEDDWLLDGSDCGDDWA